MENREKTNAPPPHEIERNLHHLFDAIDEALKQSGVSKRIQSNIMGYCLAILSNGMYIGEMCITHEERQEWIFKYQGYEV